MKTKKCSKCKKTLPMTKFGYRVSTSGNPITQSQCIPCRSVKPKKGTKKVKKSKKVSK